MQSITEDQAHSEFSSRALTSLSRASKPPSGFTLVELVLAMTIIAIALQGTLIAINTTIKYSADPLMVHQAIAISESYLDEIFSKSLPATLPCSSPQPAGGRINYSSVCDYKYIPAGGQVPTDQLGNPISGLGAYTVQVNIDDTTAALQGLTALSSQVVRIDVTVSRSNMPTISYSVYRTNY